MIIFSSRANFEESWKIFWVTGKVLFWFCPFANSSQFYLIFLNKRKESLERKSCFKLKTWNASFWKCWNESASSFGVTKLTGKSHPALIPPVKNESCELITLQQKGPWTSSCEVTVSWGQSASQGRHIGPDLQRNLGTKRCRQVQSGIYKSTWAR